MMPIHLCLSKLTAMGAGLFLLLAPHVAAAQQQWSREDRFSFVVVKEAWGLRKGDVARARAIQDGDRWAVAFYLTKAAAKRFAEITRENKTRQMMMILGDRILVAPIIMSELAGGSVLITGNYTEAQAKAITRRILALR